MKLDFKLVIGGMTVKHMNLTATVLWYKRAMHM